MNSTKSKYAVRHCSGQSVRFLASDTVRSGYELVTDDEATTFADYGAAVAACFAHAMKVGEYNILRMTSKSTD